MSFIQKIFGGIFAFLGGIFGFFARLLGLKKSQYFLELDEAKDNNKTASLKPAAKPEPAQAKASAPEPAKAETPKAEAPKPAKAEAPKAEAVKSATAKAEKSAEPAKAPEPVATASKEAAPAVTFASDFLLTTAGSNGRRRPGPSMNYFIDMARQVKTPR